MRKLLLPLVLLVSLIALCRLRRIYPTDLYAAARTPQRFVRAKDHVDEHEFFKARGLFQDLIEERRKVLERLGIRSDEMYQTIMRDLKEKFHEFAHTLQESSCADLASTYLLNLKFEAVRQAYFCAHAACMQHSDPDEHGLARVSAYVGPKH